MRARARARVYVCVCVCVCWLFFFKQNSSFVCIVEITYVHIDTICVFY